LCLLSNKLYICQTHEACLRKIAIALPPCPAGPFDQMIAHEVVYSLLGFTGKIIVAHKDRFDLADGLPLLDESERAQLRRILQLGFHYSQLEAFVTAQLFGLRPGGADAGPPAETAVAAARLPRSPYVVAFAEALEEVLQPYRARVLELEQQVIRTPELSLPALQLGFSGFELVLPALCQLVSTVQAEALSGARLLDELHAAACGSTLALRGCVEQLLAHTQRVLLSQLSAWLIYGELLPGDGEFFVRRAARPAAAATAADDDDDDDDDDDGSTAAAAATASPPSLEEEMVNGSEDGMEGHTRLDYSAWSCYELAVECKPQLLSMQTAKGVLFVGKAVHVLRRVDETVAVDESAAIKAGVEADTKRGESGAADEDEDEDEEEGEEEDNDDATSVTEAGAEAGTLAPVRRRRSAVQRMQRRLRHLSSELEALQVQLPLDAAGVHALEGTVDRMQRDASALLWRYLAVESGLPRLLHALKSYFLLGRGEIFHALLQELRPHMASPPTVQIDLQSALVHAASGAEDLDEHFGRLTLILPGTKPRATVGVPPGAPGGVASASSLAYDAWRHLSLQLEVKWPLKLLVHASSLQRYKQLFSFLLLVKRVQTELHAAWTSQTLCGTMASHRRAVLMPLWRLRAHMAFVIDNLQYYLQVDAARSKWLSLVTTSCLRPHPKARGSSCLPPSALLRPAAVLPSHRCRWTCSRYSVSSSPRSPRRAPTSRRSCKRTTRASPRCTRSASWGATAPAARTARLMAAPAVAPAAPAWSRRLCTRSSSSASRCAACSRTLTRASAPRHSTARSSARCSASLRGSRPSSSPSYPICPARRRRRRRTSRSCCSASTSTASLCASRRATAAARSRWCRLVALKCTVFARPSGLCLLSFVSAEAPEPGTGWGPPSPVARNMHMYMCIGT